MLQLQTPYVIFIGDVEDDLAAKTAAGILDWRPGWCIGKIALPGCKARLDLPSVTVSEAVEKGAKTLVIGVVNRGGVLPDSWVSVLVEALEAGLDLASGLHKPLAAVPELKHAAEAHGCRLIDVRIPSRNFDVGSGEKRRGKRLLCVGTDCSVGKKYTALALERDMKARGMLATFRATGQTGIFIAGGGVAVDAVVADFISGAAEWLSPNGDPNHWDVIEGQGSLFHPSFAGVSLGLLHGSQPDAMVLCHEPTRTTMRGVDYPLPGLRECIELNETLARRVNPKAGVIGLAVNTKALAPGMAERVLKKFEHEVGLPTVDPMVQGCARLIDNLPK